MTSLLHEQDYVGSVCYSADDEVFFGKIEGIDDLVTFEGKSVPQLKEAFHKAVRDYTEIALANGKEPEKTYRGSLNPAKAGSK